MYVPDYPRFRPQWYSLDRPDWPDWLDDERWFPPGDRELFVRGRVGLNAALGQLPPADGDVALLPAYAPFSLVEVFEECGYRVRYYPMEPDLTLPASRVADRITALSPSLVLFAHFFGLVDPAFDELAGRARDAGATIVEDCARAAFARRADGTPLGATGDIAIYSLYKTLPIPNGGLVIAPDLSIPSAAGSTPDGGAALKSAAVDTFRRMSVPPVRMFGLTEPMARSVEEARSADRSLDRLPTTRPGRVSANGLSQVEPERVVAQRRSHYRALRPALSAVDGIEVLSPPAHRHDCPFGVTVRAPTAAVRDRLYRELRLAGLPAEVYRWPAPAPEAAEAGAQAIRRRVLVVPTHQQLSTPARDRIVDVVAAAAAAGE
ncbi:MAG: DegT/DnrJ/EryC1/StrS family aminotransferase [Haloarculaceae archaeon]